MGLKKLSDMLRLTGVVTLLTTGYMFQVNGTAVTWQSKKQSCVALSSAEAEYVALTAAAHVKIWQERANL